MCVLVWALPLYPALLAGVCGGVVCVWARVSAAHRHSWLGCWGVSFFFGCLLPLYPATVGSGVRRGCVCLGSGFGCAPPLLAGVLGCVCAGVGAPLVPCHSWLGGAPWVCVFGLGFRLRPATPGWGVRVCVCSCACPPCIPPLLAGVRGVGVFVWAPVSAAPRHSWLGCWGVYVLVCVLLLYPATLGWGVRPGCVFLGSGFGCTPPLLAGVLGCACLCACSPCTPPLLAGVRSVGVCAWARVSAAPRHSWLGCWAVCVLVCALRLYPATVGWGVRCGCGCLGSGFGCAPPLPARVCGVCVCWCGRSPCTPALLAGVCGGGVCFGVRVPAAPRHSWLGCWGVRFFFGCLLALYPATPGWGVRRGCVCLGSGFGCAPPLLAGVCGVGACAWARVSAAPRHSWLGCWAVCVLVWALCLYPATPSWGARPGCVCSGSGLGCAPPLLAGVLGCVCARVRAPLVPRHSWLGCAVWVSVFGLGFRLRPATPGWGVAVCVCWCACSSCTPPLLAGVCGLAVCAWARVSAAPRHSWLGCWAVCVLVCALRLHPASPGWGARCGCVCLGSGFGCAPPLLAWVLGCVCARVRAPLAPCHSWLGCAVWVCVFGLGFRLRPATPGWGVRCGCVCLGSGFGCAPPLLAGVCGVWVGYCLAPVRVPWFVACCARSPG